MSLDIAPTEPSPPVRARRGRSLTATLVITLVALATLGLAATGVVATISLDRYLLDQTDDGLISAAQPFLAHGGEELRSSGDAQDSTGIASSDAPTAPPSQFYVVVSAADGTVTDTLSNLLDVTKGTPILPKLTVAAAKATQGAGFTVSGSTGRSWRVVALPKNDGSGTITVATDLGNLQSTVKRLTILELGGGATVVALLALLAFLFVRRSLAPLREVESAADAVAAGDLDRRVATRDPHSEVGQLANAFNTMVTRVQESFVAASLSEEEARGSAARMRRFVADAGHELRTPLTTIRGFAELHRQGALATPVGTARAMDRIESEATRMGSLVDDLLTLARLDATADASADNAAPRPPQAHPVDLALLATDAVLDAGASHPGREVTLELPKPGSGTVVNGDEQRLRQVLSNVVDNALRHTPPEASVHVRIEPAATPGGNVVLQVADNGPGMGAEEAARVFDRFYRADVSRTRVDGGGTGLGLSIVAAIVAAHDGSVHLRTAPGEGATFTVVLPAATV